MMNDLDTLRARLREFAAARDWEQFHSPKNLAMALAAEAGELLEVFQWMSEAQSRALESTEKSAAAQEMADVLLYLVRLADVTGVDLIEAARHKIEINADKYPADKARGTRRKYTEL
jgi:dCTP diphosphatase